MSSDEETNRDNRAGYKISSKNFGKKMKGRLQKHAKNVLRKELKEKEEKVQHSKLVPPWTAFPEIPFGETAWRMGEPESQMQNFAKQIEKMTKKEREEYFFQNCPENKEWQDWVQKLTSKQSRNVVFTCRYCKQQVSCPERLCWFLSCSCGKLTVDYTPEYKRFIGSLPIEDTDE